MEKFIEHGIDPLRTIYLVLTISCLIGQGFAVDGNSAPARSPIFIIWIENQYVEVGQWVNLTIEATDEYDDFRFFEVFIHEDIDYYFNNQSGDFRYEAKTKDMSQALANLNVSNSTLLVTSGKNEDVVRTARNLPKVFTLPVDLLSAGALLRRENLLMTVDAVRRAEELWGNAGASDNGEEQA